MYGLYPIVDADVAQRQGVPLSTLVDVVAEAGPRIVQLRAKYGADQRTVEVLRALRARCPQGTLVFSNDRPDLAVLAGCDGVHVGQSDLSVKEVRRFAPSLKVGVSTHDLAQVKLALLAKPDYLAFGPVYRTASKQAAEPVVGLQALAAAQALCAAVSIPLVAIGGIRREVLPALAGRCEMVAVIGALFRSGTESGALLAETKILMQLAGGLA